MSNAPSFSPQEAIIRSRIIPSRRRRDGLIRYAADVTSQNGEDGILHRLFELLPAQSQSSHPIRWCVDVGAWDGLHLSNTHSLLSGSTAVMGERSNAPATAIIQFDESKEQEWRGILIEADMEKFNTLKERYAETDNVCLNVTITVAVDVLPQHDNGIDRSACSLSQLLLQQQRQNETSIPNEFDFLCIDIDGNDYWVWYDLLNASLFRPAVVCIEFNPTMPDDLVYIPPRNDNIRHGASLAALVELAAQHDYALVETTLYNAFFVRKHLYEQYLVHEVPDTSIEALHDSNSIGGGGTMCTSLYQLYDGTLKVWGCKKLLWHRVPIDEGKLQMIPQQQRSFPFAPSRGGGRLNEREQFDDSNVIDVSAYCCSPTSEPSDSEVNEARALCSQVMLDQLRTTGFCLVRGTGMTQGTCQAALDATHLFLQEADEQVRRSCLSSTDRARRGYSPINVENFASLIGQHGPNDLVRKFRMGPILENSNSQDAAVIATRRALWQPNIWPDQDTWTEAIAFQSAIEAYYAAACTASKGILRAICDGLLLAHPELSASLSPLFGFTSTSDESCSRADETTSILTLLGYREGTRHKGKSKGPVVAEHTDVGVITMLLYDGGCSTCATLQRSDGNGGWVDVQLPATVPSNPVFVINVADCLAELSHGTIPSTLHRVVANRLAATVPRNCCALFVGLHPDTKMSAMDDDSMTYEEWRKCRIAKAMNALKDLHGQAQTMI